MPSMRTVGYRQIRQYLTGSISYYEMVERAISASRQLAKRQLTWLRKYPDVAFVEIDGRVPVAECMDLFIQQKAQFAPNCGYNWI